MPVDQPLTISIDGKTHELEVEISKTPATGEIKKDGTSFTASVTLTEPSKESYFVTIDNKDVSVGEEDKPSASAGSYDSMLVNYISMMITQQLSYSLVESNIPQPTEEAEYDREIKTDIKDSKGTVVGSMTYKYIEGQSYEPWDIVSFELTADKTAYITNESYFTWTGSMDYSTSDNKETYSYNNFRITDVGHPDAVPAGFKFSSISGTAEADTESLQGFADLAFNGEKYDTEGMMTMMYLFMVPTALSGSDCVYEGNSGSLENVSSSEVPMTGTWSKAGGEISINGSITVGNYSFTLRMSESSSADHSNREIIEYTFEGEDVNHDYVNFIMGIN